jgi:hypothetical protein
MIIETDLNNTWVWEKNSERAGQTNQKIERGIWKKRTGEIEETKGVLLFVQLAVEDDGGCKRKNKIN